MPQLRNFKHERFAQLVAVDVSFMGAYEMAGYTPRRGNPNRLARQPKVAARIAELRSEIRPADIASLECVHTKLVTVAVQLAQTAPNNRDMLSRTASDLRRLSHSLDHLAGTDFHLCATMPVPLMNNRDSSGFEIAKAQ